MALPVYARAGDLSHLLDYFLDRVLIGDSPLNVEKIVPKQLELAVKQDNFKPEDLKQDDLKPADLSIRICTEGEWREALPSWYNAEMRRQQGFTPDYLQRISTAAEQAAKWQTESGTPVLAHPHCELFAPQLHFLEVTPEPERLLFTLLGYLIAKEETLLREPLRLNNYTKPSIYPR
jgi:hypothetical protein